MFSLPFISKPTEELSMFFISVFFFFLYSVNSNKPSPKNALFKVNNDFSVAKFSGAYALNCIWLKKKKV